MQRKRNWFCGMDCSEIIWSTLKRQQGAGERHWVANVSREFRYTALRPASGWSRLSFCISGIEFTAEASTAPIF